MDTVCRKEYSTCDVLDEGWDSKARSHRVSQGELASPGIVNSEQVADGEQATGHLRAFRKSVHPSSLLGWVQIENLSQRP